MTLTRQLSYAKGDEIVTLLKSANILSNRGQAFVDTRTNTLIITDLQDRLTNTLRPDRHARQAAAAGRNRSAHRPDEQELRARARRAVGLQRPRLAGARQHDQPGVSEQRHARRTEPPGRAGWNAAVNLPGAGGATSAVGLALGSVNGAFNLDVALTALEDIRQRPPAVDAARLDAEQRRGGDDAGRADSDSDRRQQHGHGVVQGRRADAQGDAADHRGEHRHHADRARERDARFQPRRSTAFRRSTPSAPSPRCSSATARRRSSAASTRARIATRGIRRRSRQHSAARLAVQARHDHRPEHGAADLHHAADHQERHEHEADAYAQSCRTPFAGGRRRRHGLVRRRRADRPITGDAGDELAVRWHGDERGSASVGCHSTRGCVVHAGDRALCAARPRHRIARGGVERCVPGSHGDDQQRRHRDALSRDVSPR